MSRVHEPDAPSRPPTPSLSVDLSGINLNLMVALDALLAEASVTRAAARVGVTQSAMSHALRQLREHLGDSLLIRGRGGMVLTPRAEQLAAPLHRGLLELQRALRNEPVFDPRTANRRFTLCTRDYHAAVLLPDLLGALEREAPHVDISIRHVEIPQVPALLESGELDLCIAVAPEPSPGLRQQKLFNEDFVCVVRKGHPAARKGMDLDTYLRHPHVLISPRGEGAGAVDHALARIGKTRRVGVRLPYFLTAPVAVAGSDYILTAPRRMSELFARAWPLKLLAPPVELPAFDVVQTWNERFDGDPAHRWLRQLVARVAAGPRSKGGRDTLPVRIQQPS